MTVAEAEGQKSCRLMTPILDRYQGYLSMQHIIATTQHTTVIEQLLNPQTLLQAKWAVHFNEDEIFLSGAIVHGKE